MPLTADLLALHLCRWRLKLRSPSAWRSQTGASMWRLWAGGASAQQRPGSRHVLVPSWPGALGWISAVWRLQCGMRASLLAYLPASCPPYLYIQDGYRVARPEYLQDEAPAETSAEAASLLEAAAEVEALADAFVEQLRGLAQVGGLPCRSAARCGPTAAPVPC